jgi:hypothetical protein
MKYAFCALAAVLATASGAAAVEAAIVSYVDGDLNFSLTGTGTVTVTAQVDFKYISAITGIESLARATSEPLKIKLTGEETPGMIQFVPPDGAIVEVEAVIFIDGDEKARQVYYLD